MRLRAPTTATYIDMPPRVNDPVWLSGDDRWSSYRPQIAAVYQILEVWDKYRRANGLSWEQCDALMR